jgi:adenylosuccinate synthase
MTEKIYTVTDLGPGDGGKGGVVHKISSLMNAHTVIKRGGANGSHGVFTSAGNRFAFSQWGCGTFEGVRTHLSPQMVISPEGLLNEADALRYEHGIYDAFDLLTVDERALCATPYHGIASRIREMIRGKNPRGTVGTGVGEAYRDSERFPELTIRAGDLSQPNLKKRLAAVRENIWQGLFEGINGEFLPEDRERVNEEVALLNADNFFKYVVERFVEVSKQAKIVAPEFLGREILSKDGVAVVESSHGILTDCFHGFYPHTSAIRTLPCFTHTMLKEAGYVGQVVNLGVTRAYAIRHGAGPMPTDDPTMSENLLPGSHKEENRYQGKVRVGPIDLVLLRYAIEVCGGPAAFDGLAITWFDQIQTNGAWHVCNSYRGTGDGKFFSPSGAIKVRRGTDEDQINYQIGLRRQLESCLPEITKHTVQTTEGREELFSLCDGLLKSELGVPVRMVSFGPTELDKVCQ